MKPQPGTIWRHDKGTFYKVLAVGRIEAAPETEAVIYQALEPSFEVWIRPLVEWEGFMPNGRPRFVMIEGRIL